jgi:hypothetical protein
MRPRLRTQQRPWRIGNAKTGETAFIVVLIKLRPLNRPPVWLHDAPDIATPCQQFARNMDCRIARTRRARSWELPGFREDNVPHHRLGPFSVLSLFPQSSVPKQAVKSPVGKKGRLVESVPHCCDPARSSCRLPRVAVGAIGRMQREGDAIHVMAEQLEDLSDVLRSVGHRQRPFPVPPGPGDGATPQNGPDPRQAGASEKAAVTMGATGILVPTRSFR